MLSISAEQLQGVGKQVNHGCERIDCAAGTAGQIHDQRFSAYSADSPAERGKWRLLRAFKTHAFGKAFDQTFANRARGFGRDVTLGDSGTARGHDELDFLHPVRNRFLNCGLVIGNDFRPNNRKISFSEKLSNCRAGNVCPLAAGTGIADRDNGRG